MTHLHGSYNPPEVDGNPDSWFTGFGETGPGFRTNNYTYQNCQEPATLWFHDHALGLTRNSVYAGLVHL